MSETDLVTLSIRIYKWQKELLERQPINKSELIRDLLTQYFKGGSMGIKDKNRVLIEEAKEAIKKAEEEKRELERIFKEYSELIEEAKRKVQEVEQELKQLAEQEDRIKQEDEESELKGLIEEVYDDVLERGVDGWVRDNIAGANGIKVRFYKVLPKMAKERGIKLDLKKAKEIIQKYYPEIAKYLG